MQTENGKTIAIVIIGKYLERQIFFKKNEKITNDNAATKKHKGSANINQSCK